MAFDHSLNLTLSVSRGISRADDPDSVYSDAVFSHIRPTILKDQDFTCYYCSFKANKWQDVHHLDGDHKNNNPKNLVVTCRLCHLCNHLGYVGTHNLAGLIICPAISQQSLNNIVRSLWVGKNGADKDIREQSTALLDSLYGFPELALREYGYDGSLHLANELLKLPAKKYSDRHKYLADMRLLFFEPGFRDQIHYWSTETYQSIPTKTWTQIASDQLQIVS